ncbi:hypothetical protein ACJMK2_040139 [Sinanodonta woodiana]|uniref:V-SNARE coiled-coil homology domain-containing protein n=1 Tax=Sinanodonta woodiana TaxID=1069815 RepID=A0ABD3WE57_SINWO
MPPKFVRTPEQKDYANSRDVEKRALLDADSDEDDFFLNGPKVRTDKLHGKDPKVSRLQGQVEEVVGVMKSNVEKVLERGDRLEDLQDKSDGLAMNSDIFRNRAKQLQKNMWWKNCRMRIIMVMVILIVLAVIIVPIVVSQINKN